ncbi:glycosyl hydrolase catalytic core-domain-containing protein [Mycena haematopus]|nr:glycosyl hydrolase catalytic core-domain-containing protein [Mycena haematopus]
MTLTIPLLFLAQTTLAQLTSRTLTVTNTSKAGIASGAGNTNRDLVQFTSTGKVSWYYTWGLHPVLDTNLEFVPMFWGQPDDVTQWTDPSEGINATISELNPTAVLGMNEPQDPGQSNMTPQEGAEMWINYIEPLRAQGLRLGSPSTSSAPSGKIWMQDFFTACNGACTVDFVALHFYDVNATAFSAYLIDFYDTFQLPIWVTEWACQNYKNLSGPQCTAPEVAEFLNQSQTFMDAQDWIERYSWYGIMRNPPGVNPLNAMMDSNGKITDLGKQYIGPPSTNGGMMRRARWWTLWGVIPILLCAYLL